MADVYITQHGSYLHKEQDCLVVKYKSELIAKVPFKEIDSIQLFGNVQFSTQFLVETLKRNISFSFYTHRGGYLGQMIPPFSKNIPLRLKQTNLHKDEKFRLDASKQILFAKFAYSIHFLEDSMINHPELIFKEKLSQLRKWKYKLLDANDIGTLFGLEGSFANIYYSCYLAKGLQTPNTPITPMYIFHHEHSGTASLNRDLCDSGDFCDSRQRKIILQGQMFSSR